MQPTILKEQAIVYFRNVSEHKEEVLQMLVSHVLHERANRVNEDVLMDLSFLSLYQTATCPQRQRENVQKSCYWSLHSDIRFIWHTSEKWGFIGYHGETYRSCSRYRCVCNGLLKSAKEISRAELSSSSLKLEADHAKLKPQSEYDGQAFGTHSQNAFTATAEALLESFVVNWWWQ